MICANKKCNKEFFDDYRKGRKRKDKEIKYCSRSCANSRNISDDIKLKLSEAGKRQIGKKLSEEHKINIAKGRNRKRVCFPSSILDIGPKTTSKIMKKLNKPCSNCGWHKEDVLLDVHHIIEKNKGGSNNHDNLTYICPNCHRMAHSGIIESSKFIPISEYIKDEWLEYYYI